MDEGLAAGTDAFQRLDTLRRKLRELDAGGPNTDERARLEREIAEAEATMAASGVIEDTLEHLAAAAGPGSRAGVRMLKIEAERKKREQRKAEHEEQAKKQSTWRDHLTPAAWAARELDPPDHLMGELFSTTSRVLIAADTGLGKSMLGLAIAFAMRLGRSFLRWKAHRPARVLVLDGEMPTDLLKERIALACSWFDVDPPADGLFVLSREDVENMPPLDSDEGREWLLDVIKVLGVDFVILDNVSCLTVGDLREETTWKPLVPLARELSRRKVGQLWLHHVGHDKSRVYGSRTFAWTMDAVGLGTAVHRDGADVSMKIEWQKARRRTPANREDFEPVHIVLEDSAWTGTLSGTVQGSNGKPVSLTPSGRVVLKALEAALAATGEKPPAHDVTRGVVQAVRLKTWQLYLSQVGGYEQDRKGRDAERKAWDRGRENLLAGGKVSIWGEWAWPL